MVSFVSTHWTPGAFIDLEKQRSAWWMRNMWSGLSGNAAFKTQINMRAWRCLKNGGELTDSKVQAPSQTGFVVRWYSISGKTYKIRRVSDLLLGTPEILASGIAATPPINTYTANVGTAGTGFYRVIAE